MKNFNVDANEMESDKILGRVVNVMQVKSKVHDFFFLVFRAAMIHGFTQR